MIKALWFIAKLALIVGIVLWIAERPGSVRIEWLDYTITVHIGLFFAGLIAALVLAIFIYRVIRTFVDLPSSYRYYSKIKGREKGYRAMTLGLTAVAAGDTKAALREAAKARKLLPDDEGIALLLSAQAARLDGRDDDANACFVALLENKDAAFLGLRGLLQASMDKGEYSEALPLAKQALALHPKQPWILKVVYDLHVRLRAWSDAEDVLARAVRAGAIEKGDAVSDRVAMALAIALEAAEQGLDDVAVAQFKKARKLDGEYVPAVILFAEYYAAKQMPKKAIALVEGYFKGARDDTAHSEIAALWGRLAPAKYTKDELSKLRWVERLVGLNAYSFAAQLAAGGAAIDAGLWGEARQYLEAAENIRTSASLYRAFSKLAQRGEQDDAAARSWLEKAAAASSDRAWICESSNVVYDFWRPIAEPSGAFNTIRWVAPDLRAEHDGSAVLQLSSGHDISERVARDLDAQLQA